ncbi:MAG: DNA mismatch repair endonuclease MutL [Nitrospirota bacterium]|nr:DNA mismatch repair endonuclease MutL [Nitrospirota bacterium]
MIKILPDNLINKIAAGEVVERPSSVVKELIENALDAGAVEVLVDIEQAGKRLIRISDNGAGMAREDARLAFERHATSKISSEADLEAIRTMGFRGEALSSIAAVSRVRMITARRGGGEGTLVEIDGGTLGNITAAPASPGTSIEVSHLFFNTPARLKFLKSPATEFSHISAALSHQAMAHPAVRFKLTHNKKTVFDLLAAESLRERARQVFGEELTENLIELSAQREPVHLSGLIGKPNYSRGDKTCQEFYVNGRFVRNPSLSHGLYQAYADLLMRDRHPAAILFLDLDPALVDVNVHPAKTEVRFRNQSQIHDLVRDAVREALSRSRSSVSRDRSLPPAAVTMDAVADPLAPYVGSSGKPNETVHPHSYGRRRTDQSAALPHEHAPERSAPEQLPAFLGEVLVPLAQVHDSFIVAQSSSGMALIDQHAAHERILFEQLQDQHARGTVPAQNLLIPLQIEVGPAEQELLAEAALDLEKLGLVMEPFGGRTFIIKAVPALLIKADPRKLLNDILDELKVHGSSNRMDVLRNEVLSVMACHPAVKVHRHLTVREMDDLIRDLFVCRMPHSCPHGRPTIVRFSMDEIRKMFKRI